MEADFLAKLLFAVAGAFGGWILAQVSAVVKDWLYRRKIKKALLQELSDIAADLQRVQEAHARNLRAYGAMQFPITMMIGLSNPIYSGYYKDAILSLNTNQKISYHLVHGYLSRQNEITKEINEVMLSAHKDHGSLGAQADTDKAAEVVHILTRRAYSLGCNLLWTIDHHINNNKDPDLTAGSEARKAYSSRQATVIEEINSIVESGRSS